MSEQNPGCFQVGCSLWIIAMIIFGVIYSFSGDSIDSVKKANFDTITKIIYSSTDSTPQENENKHKILLNLKLVGEKSRDHLQDVLKSNKYIHDINYSINCVSKKEYVVSVKFNLYSTQSNKINSTMNFAVTPKSFTDGDLFNNVVGLYNVEMLSKDRNASLTDGDDIIKFLNVIYFEDSAKKTLDLKD